MFVNYCAVVPIVWYWHGRVYIWGTLKSCASLPYTKGSLVGWDARGRDKVSVSDDLEMRTGWLIWFFRAQNINFGGRTRLTPWRNAGHLGDSSKWLYSMCGFRAKRQLTFVRAETQSSTDWTFPLLKGLQRRQEEGPTVVYHAWLHTENWLIGTDRSSAAGMNHTAPTAL